MPAIARLAGLLHCPLPPPLARALLPPRAAFHASTPPAAGKLPGFGSGSSRAQHERGAKLVSGLKDMLASSSSRRSEPKAAGKPRPPRVSAVPLGKQQTQSRIQREIEQRKARVRKQEAGQPRRAVRDEEIDASMVSLVAEDGSAQGVQPLATVLSRLDRDQYTLVLVDAHADPPVCRVFQRSLLYDHEKRARKQAQEQKRKMKVHMLVLRSSIGEHDVRIKCNKLVAMLAKGLRVAVTVELGPREKNWDKSKEVGLAVMKNVEEHAVVLSPPSHERGVWTVSLQGKDPK
ncbi:hypothetical protein LPJ70_001453 [Coemansia sp. RSA 2708]|nr:hypothetical protein LPJ70_001453 [Coemansia sp. RSA 2708]